ncbi:MAG: prepilin peptidase [Patescibacteria group bacterium]
MDFLTLAIVFVVGTIIGSFLNVVIYRYNSGTSPFEGRSLCFSCGKSLHWYELIPILSFLMQNGRCRECGVRLSWQYPAVEIITGIVFVAVFAQGLPPVETIYLCAVFSTLLVIGVYDLRHKIIPDGLSALFAILALVWFFGNVEFANVFSYPYVWTLIAGPMIFLPFWALWFVSGGRWIGLGDGKLGLGIGWFLGATLGGSAVLLAFWIGAAWALAAMALQKILAKVVSHRFQETLSMKSEIPFGPFLIVSVFVIYFTGANFFDGSINLFGFL